MNEPSLKFNRETGRYELIVTISVDAEIFRRLLYKYVEDNHIDPTDLDAWQQAVNAVARADKWLNHPHATVLTGKQPGQQPQVVEALPLTEAEQEAPLASPFAGTRLSAEEKALLRKRALDTSADEWETLLTPLPPFPRDETVIQRVKWVQHRRVHERKVLEQLKQELEPLSMERLSAIASVTNGARLK